MLGRLHRFNIVEPFSPTVIIDCIFAGNTKGNILSLNEYIIVHLVSLIISNIKIALTSKSKKLIAYV